MGYFMKIAIISDIHGNYEALKSVLGQIDKMQVDRILCLGDVVGYYSQVNECCDALQERNIPCLFGNHDWYMAGGGYCPRSKSVNDCLTYQRKVILPKHLSWIKSFQIQFELDDIKMVHGGWADPIDEYLEISEEYFNRIEGRYFFSGHTHLQSLYQWSTKTYCNPGSVGQPRDNDPRAAFAVYSDGEITLHRVEYDVEKVFQLMDKAGFNDYYYGCLKTGAKNLCRLPEN
jgi:putative phosphoesterase